MEELAKKYGASPLPGVNLLPKEIAEKRAMRAVQVTALLVVLIAVGVVVVGYVLALGTKALAQNSLEDSRSEQTIAISERDSRSPVFDGYREREIQEYTLAQLGYGAMDYSQLAAAILATADAESGFDSVSFNTPTAFGLSGVNADAVFGGGIGGITFEARALSFEGASELIARIEAVPGIVRVDANAEAYATDGADLYWQVSGAAGISDLRLTNAYLPQGGITGLDGSVIDLGGENGATVVEPEPAASASPSPEPEESN